MTAEELMTSVNDSTGTTQTQPAPTSTQDLTQQEEEELQLEREGHALLLCRREPHELRTLNAKLERQLAKPNLQPVIDSERDG